MRQALPVIGDFLQADTQILRWRSDRLFTLDILDFERAIAQAGAAEREGDPRALRSALVQAIQTYGGDLLPGCYDEWLLDERERLRLQYDTALERLVDCLEEQREYALAITYAQRLLRRDPLHEATYRRLMRLHGLNNDRASALRVYQQCVTTLRHELAVEPSPATLDAYERLSRIDDESSPASRNRTATGRPHLVGREREWRKLQAVWDTASRGNARLVLIAGEAGIGKTRLAEELLAWAEAQGLATARARSYAAEGRLAYAPIADWLRSAAIRPGVAHLDAVWRTAIARLLPELLAEDPCLERPPPLTESWQLQHFYAALAQAVATAAQPLLLLIDDLQWSDPGTLEWLHYLLRFDREARLLVAGTVRDEEVGPDHPLHALALELRREELLADLPLGSLDVAATATLAAGIAGRELDAAAATRLYRETEGHPLFIVETVRAGGEAGAMPGTPAVPDLAPLDTPEDERGSLPPKVQAVIAARLARLSPPAREIVGLAATVGRAFTAAVLNEASVDDDEYVTGALDELWQRQILREQGADAYDFSHDKIREVAYAEINPARRRLLHRRVARALELLYADDLDPVSGQLAAHYERAGELEQAVAYYHRAAEILQEVYANVDAIRLLERGLTLLARLPGKATRDVQELALLTTYSVSLNALKTFDAPTGDERYGAEMDHVYARVTELSERLGITVDPRTLRTMALVLITRGQVRRSLALGEQLLDIARHSAADPVLRTEAHYTIGAASHWLGQFRAAREHLDAALTYYDRQRHRIHIVHYAQDPGAICLIRLAYTLLHLGYPEQAKTRADEALALARELQHPQSLAYTLNWFSLIALELRDLQTARERINEAMDVAREHQLGTWQLIGNPTLGLTLALAGDVHGAVDRIRQGISGDYATGQLLHAPQALAQLTDAYRLLGAAGEGLDAVAEAFRLVERTDVRFIEASLHRLKGELLLLQGGNERAAETCFRRALAVARQQEARMLELRAALSLGRLLQQQGGEGEARETLDAIYGWFSEGFDTPDLRDARELLTTLQTLN
ncbi:MAG TPA: AAA family ATPase [Thermomicrobiales bacterium]|nr:AAA family ATPase [Thermomicrobiales bacterium]